MNNILKPNGEYITTSFTGANGTWQLVGTESRGNTPMQCKDEFRNISTGKRMTVTRLSVYSMAESGSINIVTPEKKRNK